MGTSIGVLIFVAREQWLIRGDWWSRHIDVRWQSYIAFSPSHEAGDIMLTVPPTVPGTSITKAVLEKEPGNPVEIHIQNHHRYPVGALPSDFTPHIELPYPGTGSKQSCIFRFGSFVSLYHCVHRIVAPWFEIWQDSGWELGRDSSIDVTAARIQAIQFDSPSIAMYVHHENPIIENQLMEIPCCYALAGGLLESWGCGLLKTEVLRCDTFLFLAQPRDIIINGINMHNHMNKCINILWQELFVYIDINNTLVISVAYYTLKALPGTSYILNINTNYKPSNSS